jgi:hypothetical protein
MASAHASETKRDEIAKGGRRWFFLMVPLSIILTAQLYRIDRYLSENDKEEQKGALLRELRTAQAGVGSVSYDDRQGGYATTSGGLAGLIKMSPPKAAESEVAEQARLEKAETNDSVPADDSHEESVGDVPADH